MKHAPSAIVALACFALATPSFAAKGGPTVSIDNQPIAVEVTNTVEIQGAVEIVNDLLTIPFTFSLSRSISVNTLNNLFNITIPADKVLVIKTVSATVRAAPGAIAGGMLEVYGAVPGAGNGFVVIPMVPLYADGSTITLGGSTAVDLRIDPSKYNVRGNVFRSGAEAPAEADFSIIGHLADR
jgi:hypothetical protein